MFSASCASNAGGPASMRLDGGGGGPRRSNEAGNGWLKSSVSTRGPEPGGAAPGDEGGLPWASGGGSKLPSRTLTDGAAVVSSSSSSVYPLMLATGGGA